MIIPLKQILHLRVETASGVHLGDVSGLEINVEQHTVHQYVVKSLPLPKPLATELLISPSQVVSIDDKKMIVEDSVVPAADAAITPA